MAERTDERGDAEALREFLAERDVACPGCGYSLRGVEQASCPECGEGLALEIGRRRSGAALKLALVLVGAMLAVRALDVLVAAAFSFLPLVTSQIVTFSVLIMMSAMVGVSLCVLLVFARMLFILRRPWKPRLVRFHLVVFGVLGGLFVLGSLWNTAWVLWTNLLG